MITFRATEGSPIAGRLAYDEEHFAFATEPRPEGCVASLLIHELELMLNEEEQRVVFVTGYCPYQSWRPSVIRPPKHRPGLLYAVLEKPIVPGTSRGLHPTEENWPILVDRRSGWVRLGKSNPADDPEGVAFAPGAVVVLDGGRLVALWLRPDQLPRGLPAAS